jgi:DedD protein
MEERSKRRLVGTAVVVVLLVIFLPMLLEEEPPNPVPDSDLEIPPRPEFAEGLNRGGSEPAADTFSFPATPELPPPDSYAESAPGGPDRAARAQPEPEPEPEPVAARSPQSPPPAPAQPVAPSAEQAASRPSPMPAQSGPGWVLQVSSLTEHSRASRLERELRAEGFPVFIEKAEVGGKIYHRVRIGPRAERSDIETMAASVKAKTGYQGQILRYP